MNRDPALITVCPDGPYLIRGPFTVLDTEGNEALLTRKTISLCRCGRSAQKPFCDGTHKQTNFRDPARFGEAQEGR